MLCRSDERVGLVEVSGDSINDGRSGGRGRREGEIERQAKRLAQAGKGKGAGR